MTTDQRISVFKYSVILIGMILLFMFWRGCKNSGSGKAVSDTLNVKVDTVYVQSKADTFYTPAVVKTEYRSVIKYKTDTLESFEYIPVDTVAILKNHYATRYYEDQISVKYGRLTINDTITRNAIAGRGVKTDFNIPVVEKTITVARPKRNVVYIGFGALGSEQSFLEQTKATIGVKAKNEKYYGIETALSRSGNILIGFEFKIPIRLTKK